MADAFTYCEQRDLRESVTLTRDTDFRLPQHRREVFLRFMEFHTKWLVQPGIVYRLLPYMKEHLGWDVEQTYWAAFVNGNTQNPVTTYLILQSYPTMQAALRDNCQWFREARPKLDFDTDRRHWRYHFPEAVARYAAIVGESQAEWFAAREGDDEWQTWRLVWPEVRARFYGFGRLSAWSYLEYLRILGYPIQPESLLLDDKDGSRSHRNGLCKVAGRDDLDWHDSNPTFDGKYTPEDLAALEQLGFQLLMESQTRAHGLSYAQHVTYFTLESALCTYKSWFRPRRRYPMVYVDMLWQRIKKAEAAWPAVDFSLFWDARAYLPEPVLLEKNRFDKPLTAEKQDHFRLLGCPVNMDLACGGWDCFQNPFNDRMARERRGDQEEFQLR